MSKISTTGGGCNTRHPTLVGIDAVRIRKTGLEVPTAAGKPIYNEDEIAEILASLGVDAATSAGRFDQLDALYAESPSPVILALIYREIERWEAAP
jgi:hypothetical protein